MPEIEEINDNDDYIPVQKDEKFMPENMTAIIDKFVDSNTKTSKDKFIDKTKDKKIIMYDIPTKHMERITPDEATANLDYNDKRFVEEALGISQSLQFVEGQLGIDLSKASNFFTEMAHLTSNVSKGKDFALLKNIRTDRSEAMSRYEKMVNNPNAQNKRRWF